MPRNGYVVDAVNWPASNRRIDARCAVFHGKMQVTTLQMADGLLAGFENGDGGKRLIVWAEAQKLGDLTRALPGCNKVSPGSQWESENRSFHNAESSLTGN